MSATIKLLRSMNLLGVYKQSIEDEIGLLNAFAQDDATQTKIHSLTTQKNQIELVIALNQDTLETIENADTNEPVKILEAALQELNLKYDENGYPYYEVSGHRIPSMLGRLLVGIKRAAAKRTLPAPVEKFLSVFDIIKKFIDIIDDVWGAIGRAGLPKKLVSFISPILVGTIGMIVHGTEAVRSLYHAIKNIGKEKSVLRNPKIIANAFIFSAAAAGFSASLIYLIANFSIYIAGSAFMPVIIPSMVAVIAGIGLIHNLYRYHVVMQNINSIQLSIEIYKKEIKEHEGKIAERKAKQTALLKTLEDLDKSTPDYADTLKKNADILAQMATEDSEDQLKIVAAKQNIKKANLDIHTWNEKRSNAARHATFRGVELLATTIVIIGIILGTTAIVGAVGAASFGAATPLAIIITGVVLGFALKAFEHFDGKKNFRLTTKILNGLKNLVFGQNSKSDLIESCKKDNPPEVSANNNAPVVAQANLPSKQRTASFAGFVRPQVTLRLCANTDPANNSNAARNTL